MYICSFHWTATTSWLSSSFPSQSSGFTHVFPLSYHSDLKAASLGLIMSGGQETATAAATWRCVPFSVGQWQRFLATALMASPPSACPPRHRRRHLDWKLPSLAHRRDDGKKNRTRFSLAMLVPTSEKGLLDVESRATQSQHAFGFWSSWWTDPLLFVHIKKTYFTYNWSKNMKLRQLQRFEGKIVGWHSRMWDNRFSYILHSSTLQLAELHILVPIMYVHIPGMFGLICKPCRCKVHSVQTIW